MNLLTRIADWYTETPDSTPELTVARFFAGMVERYGTSAVETAQYDPNLR